MNEECPSLFRTVVAQDCLHCRILLILARRPATVTPPPSQEPSVRQTKRRRTRDASCQTLTYRELRDYANGGKNPNRPHRGVQQQPQPRQRHHHHLHHQQQQPHHHVAPATRFVSMFHLPGSPLSSAATSSTASVYRVTDGGGIVHGAVVRGGGTGGTGRKQRPAQRRARVISGGDADADGRGPEAAANVPDADMFSFRSAHAGGAPAAATTTTARPQNSDWPLDGHGALLCSPPPSQQDGGMRDQPAQDQVNRDSALSPTDYQYGRPETTGKQRLSPPVAQVSVSWGQGPEREGATLEGESAEPFTAEGAPQTEIPSYTRGGRGPTAFEGDHEAGYHDVLASFDGLGGGTCGGGGGGGLVHEKLSKGPDYRKVRRTRY